MSNFPYSPGVIYPSIDNSLDRLNPKNLPHFERTLLYQRSLSKLVQKAGSDVEGYDSSQWNVGVPIVRLHQDGFRFAFVKATQGTTWVDPAFDLSWRTLLEARYLVGAYHFATDGPAEAQVDHFLETTIDFRKTAKAMGSYLPDSLDVEDLKIPQTKGRALVSAWSLLVGNERNRYNPVRYPVGFYSTAYHWRTITGSMLLPTNAAGWVANWTDAITYYLPPGWTRDQVVFWQKGIANYHPWVRDIPYDRRLDYNILTVSWSDALSFAGRDYVDDTGDDDDPPTVIAFRMRSLQDGLRIRTGPGTNFPVIGSLNRGDVVEVLDVAGTNSWVQHAGGWSNVQYGGDKNMEAAA